MMTAMNKSLSIAVIGGDARQIGAAKALAMRGVCVYVWGNATAKEITLPIRHCTDWRDAVRGANVLLLPLPMSGDGVHLHAPIAEGEKGIRLDSLLKEAEERLILGGKIPESFSLRAQERGVHCIDYFNSEILQLKNALPTAEGAIEIAMHELPVTLDGAHVAVIGYGRIGDLLSLKLRALGARVTVYARRPEVLTLAQLHHCQAIMLGEETNTLLSHIPEDVRVIFNTVPACLFSEEVLRSLHRGCVFIDLASAPGGIDRVAAERFGIRCIWATALPGKYAPETAGQIIAETAMHILREKELL